MDAAGRMSCAPAASLCYSWTALRLTPFMRPVSSGGRDERHVHPPEGIDWTTVSPKAEARTILTCGDELKLVYPQPGAPPERYADWDFNVFYLQPMDGPDVEANTRAAMEYCLDHPQWRLSLQTHKLLGIR
jgi:organic radical activating enzyme